MEISWLEWVIKMLPPEILEELYDKLKLEEWRNKVQEAKEREFNEEEDDEYGY